MERTAKQPPPKRVQKVSAKAAGEVANISAGPSGPGAGRQDGESAVLAVIDKMSEPYRGMGQRIHAIIRSAAPALTPRVWYGMPAYAKGGKVVCFFRGGDKFEERYMTLGFNEVANLDEGRMWPVAFALTELTAIEEGRIAALVRKAVS